MKITIKIFIICLLVFSCNSGLFAKDMAIKNNRPLNITSEEVEINRDKNRITFTKKVKAVQEKFTLYADKMVVYYKESQDKKIEIQTIKADKNVKFINDRIVATGNEGFYNVATNIITLKGNVVATESGITVHADEFEYNMNTGKTNIVGNKKQNERVTIILDNVEDLKN